MQLPAAGGVVLRGMRRTVVPIGTVSSGTRYSGRGHSLDRDTLRWMRPWLSVALGCLALGAAYACSSSSTSTPADDAGPECSADLRQACTCAGGGSGVQTCTSEGQLSGCDCASSSSTSSSGGAGPVDSSAPDTSTADVCAPPPASTDSAGDDCVPAGDCPTCVAGVAYKCTGIGGTFGGPRLASGAALAGCYRTAYDPQNAKADYCCPPACVRMKSQDSACFPANPHAFGCTATGPSGVSVVGIPSGCSAVTSPLLEAQLVCCD